MLKKTLLSLVLAVGGLTLSYPVLACEVAPQQRINNVSLVEQAAELRAQADRMDARAVASDRTADTLTREGEVLLARARTMRQQAQFVSDIDQGSLLARAETLALQASADMSQASQLRNEAMQLRTRARSLRDRAIAMLNGNGGGWRGRPRTASLDVSF